DQRSSIYANSAGGLHYDIITTMLTFDSNQARNPPDKGVVEHDALGHPLEYVDQVISAQHMRQLVQQKELDLLGRNRRQTADRPKDRGPEVTDHDRHLRHARFDKQDRLQKLESRSKNVQPLLPYIGRQADSASAHPPRSRPTADLSEIEEDEPE